MIFDYSNKKIQFISAKLDSLQKSSNKYDCIFNCQAIEYREKLKDVGLGLLYSSLYDEYKNVEVVIWRKVFYEPIQFMKRDIKKHMSQDVDEQLSNLKFSTSPVFYFYKSYICSAMAYYQNMLASLQLEPNKLNLNGKVDFFLDDTFDIFFTENEEDVHHMPEISAEILKIQAIAHQTLIYLGDLARYYSDIEKDEYHLGENLAERYYHQAILLCPDLGMPHSQLGTLFNMKYQGIIAIFHYMNCTMSNQSFEGAHSNLKRVFERVRPMYEEIRLNDTTSRYNDLSILLIKFIHLLDFFCNEELNVNLMELQNLCQEVLTLFSFNLASFNDANINENASATKNQEPSILDTKIVLQMTSLCFLIVSISQNTGSKNLSLAVAFTIGFCTYVLNRTVLNLQNGIREIMTKENEHNMQNIITGIGNDEILEQAQSSKSTTPTENTSISTESPRIPPSNRRRPLRRNKRNSSSAQDEIFKDKNEDNYSSCESDWSLSQSLDSEESHEMEKVQGEETTNENKDNLISYRNEEDLSDEVSHNVTSDKDSIESPEKVVEGDKENKDNEEEEEGGFDSQNEISDRVPFERLLSTKHNKNMKNHGKISENDLENDDKIIDVKEIENKELSEDISIKAIVDLIKREKLLCLVKIFCGWLESHNEILNMCSKSCQSMWGSFVSLLNCLPNENHLKNLDIFSQLENQLALNNESSNKDIMENSNENEDDYNDKNCQMSFFDHFSSLYCHGKKNYICLTEDLYLFGFMPLKAAQNHLLYRPGNFPSLSPEFQTLIRILQLRRFGHFISEMKEIDVLYDDEMDQFFNTFTIAEKEMKTHNIRAMVAKTDHNNASRFARSNISKVLDENVAKKKENLMRLMGHLRLKCEANVLDIDGNKGNTTGNLGNEDVNNAFMIPPPYLVPDTHVLCEKLHLVKILLNSKNFIIILPRSVLDLLDILKKDSNKARRVIRWIEAEMRDGNKYLHVQFKNEQYLDMRFDKSFDERDKKIRLLCDMMSCAKYFALKADSDKSFQQTRPEINDNILALILTYELPGKLVEKFCKPHIIKMISGINMMDINKFYDLWKWMNRDGKNIVWKENCLITSNSRHYNDYDENNCSGNDRERSIKQDNYYDSPPYPKNSRDNRDFISNRGEKSGKNSMRYYRGAKRNDTECSN